MIKVEVKKKHIELAAKRKDFCQSNRCPIALAIKERLHKKVYVCDAEDIDIYSKKYSKYTYKVVKKKDCKKVNNFINNFDNGNFKKLRPIKFKIVPVLTEE